MTQDGSSGNGSTRAHKAKAYALIGATTGKPDTPGGMPPSTPGAANAQAAAPKREGGKERFQRLRKEYNEKGTYELGQGTQKLYKRVAGYFHPDHKKTADQKPSGPMQYRFIAVPSPDTKLNLGEWVKDPSRPEVGGAFGYPGFSTTTAANWFANVGGKSVFQGMGNVTFQTPVKWTQLSTDWDASVAKKIQVTSGEMIVISAGQTSVPKKDAAKSMPVAVAGAELSPPEFNAAGLNAFLLDHYCDSTKYILKSTVKVSKARRVLGVKTLPVPELSIWQLLAMAMHQATKKLAEYKKKLGEVIAKIKAGADYARKAAEFVAKHHDDIVGAYRAVSDGMKHAMDVVGRMVDTIASGDPMAEALIAGHLGGESFDSIAADVALGIPGADHPHGLTPAEVDALRTGDFSNVQVSTSPDAMMGALQGLAKSSGKELSPLAAQNMLSQVGGGLDNLPQHPAAAVEVLRVTARDIGVDASHESALGALKSAGGQAASAAGQVQGAAGQVTGAAGQVADAAKAVAGVAGGGSLGSAAGGLATAAGGVQKAAGGIQSAAGTVQKVGGAVEHMPGSLGEAAGAAHAGLSNGETGARVLGMGTRKAMEALDRRVDAFNKRPGENGDPKEFTVKKVDWQKDGQKMLETLGDALDEGEKVVGVAQKEWAKVKPDYEKEKKALKTMSSVFNKKFWDKNGDGTVTFEEVVDGVEGQLTAAADALDALASMLGVVGKVIDALCEALDRMAMKELIQPDKPKLFLTAKDDVEIGSSNRVHAYAKSGFNFDSEKGGFKLHAEKEVALRSHDAGEFLAEKHLWLQGVEGAELTSKGPVAVGSRKAGAEVLGKTVHVGALEPPNADRKAGEKDLGGEWNPGTQDATTAVRVLATETIHALSTKLLVLQTADKNEKAEAPKVEQATPFYLSADKDGHAVMHAKDGGKLRVQVGKFSLELTKDEARLGLAHSPTEAPSAAMLVIDSEGRIALENGAARLGLDTKDAAFLLPGTSTRIELKKQQLKLNATKINIG